MWIWLRYGKMRPKISMIFHKKIQFLALRQAPLLKPENMLDLK